MKKNRALTVAGILFTIISLAHYSRLLSPFTLEIAGQEIPLWVNVLAYFIFGLLAAKMFRALAEEDFEELLGNYSAPYVPQGYVFPSEKDKKSQKESAQPPPLPSVAVPKKSEEAPPKREEARKRSEEPAPTKESAEAIYNSVMNAEKKEEEAKAAPKPFSSIVTSFDIDPNKR